VPDRQRLKRLLERIDGRSYPGYRDLKGSWQIGDYRVFIDHVQGDPFAAPSHLRVRTPTGLNPTLLTDRSATLAAEDWLLRAFANQLHGSRRGSGRSGELRCLRPGPEIIERSALRVDETGAAEIRFRCGLPARGRRILGSQAWALLSEDIPRACQALTNVDGVAAQIRCAQRQTQLRQALKAHGLVAFVADESVLPRASGTSQDPMSKAVRFRSPETMRVTLETSHGPVTGMGIAEGVTLIVGGGFHGKSTLLNALQRGHMNHIPGDGREGVVTRPATVKIRAEDGRRIVGVDISLFLNNLPHERSTKSFDTEDASGSTSQAAAIIEAIESGASALLIDEDTSATNLLVRDERMRALIPDADEPITPFVDRVRAIYDSYGVSTIMVVGGIGDYLATADTVIAMRAYHAHEATEQARAILPPQLAPGPQLPPIIPRRPRRHGLAPGKRTRARDARALQYGDHELVLTAVEQVLDAAHATSIGHAIRFLHDEIMDEKRHLEQLLDALESILDDEGVEALSPRSFPIGDLIRPRRHEVAAALSRVRTLAVYTEAPPSK
jgi:predicted ABC-class ATPase